VRIAPARTATGRLHGEAAAEPGSARRKPSPASGARGWSSLASSACSALALVLAAPAAAHLSVNPAQVRAGALVDLAFSVPNAEDARGVDQVTVRVPAAFQLDDAEAKAGWTQSRAGRAITWRGGPIPRGQFARFGIRGTAPARAGTVFFNVLAGDRTGTSSTYRVGLEVTAHGPEDHGARSLGTAALVAALVAIVLSLAALFVGLYLWLRPPPA
jgi:uncharacterized protein YcnI